MLGDEGRGAVLEACLVKIRFSSTQTHIIGMSATLSNSQHLASFLDATVFTDTFRPVCTYIVFNSFLQFTTVWMYII